MATVTGLTSTRMQAIENASVVSGTIVGDDLMLTTFGGSQINAGDVRGPQGIQGPVGPMGGNDLVASVTPNLNYMDEGSTGTNVMAFSWFGDVNNQDQGHLSVAGQVKFSGTGQSYPTYSSTGPQWPSVSLQGISAAFEATGFRPLVGASTELAIVGQAVYRTGVSTDIIGPVLSRGAAPTLYLGVYQSSGSYMTIVPINTTVPFAWTTNCIISYQASFAAKRYWSSGV